MVSLGKAFAQTGKIEKVRAIITESTEKDRRFMFEDFNSLIGITELQYAIKEDENNIHATLEAAEKTVVKLKDSDKKNSRLKLAMLYAPIDLDKSQRIIKAEEKRFFKPKSANRILLFS